MAVTPEQLKPFEGMQVCMHYHDDDPPEGETGDGMIGGILLPGLDADGFALVDYGMGIHPADITEIHLDSAPCSLYTEEERKADEAAYYEEHAPRSTDFL